MFSILNDVMTESKKRNNGPRICMPTAKSVEFNLNDSHSKDVSKGTKIETMSKKSFAFSPEVYGYYDSGYESRL